MWWPRWNSSGKNVTATEYMYAADEPMAMSVSMLARRLSSALYVPT